MDSPQSDGGLFQRVYAIAMTIEEILKFNETIVPTFDSVGVQEWAEHNLILSPRITNVPGPYSTSLTPYVREPIECFANEKIRRITLVWGAQTSKTTAILVGLAYRLSQSPCPALWVMPTESLARSFSETRWLPMIDDCPDLAKEKPDNSDKIKLMEQHFRRMSLWFVGSNSPANLASRSVSLLCLDEVDKYPDHGLNKEAGALQLAEARVATYPNHFIISTSTPTNADSTIWAEWLKGDMRFFFVPCPHCLHKQKLLFENIKWSEQARIDENNWDFKEVKKTAYYKCINCGGEIRDGQKTMMLRGGEWIPTNLKAEPERRSYHLNGLYAPWTTFGQIAVKFLQDKNSILGLQDFVNRILAEPWLEHEVKQVELRPGSYKLGELRNDEMLVMSIDVQEAGGFHVWAVIRGWTKSGETRLIWCGKLESWGDVTERVFHFNINPRAVFIDAGDQTRDVYRVCCENGYIALIGSDRPSFSEIENHQKIERPYVRSASGDPFSGKVAGSKTGWKWKLCPVWRWSNPAIKDILHNFIKTDNFIAQDTPNVYKDHLSAEVKVAVKNPTTGKTKYIWKQVGKHNHLMDCECMNIVGAALHGRLNLQPSNLTDEEDHG